MTRRKSRPDLDTFHAHLDALKLSFIREHYPDVVHRAAEEQYGPKPPFRCPKRESFR